MWAPRIAKLVYNYNNYSMVYGGYDHREMRV